MKKLLLMSLDAMIGKDIEILKQLPTFGPILKKASIVKSVETVYPSMTYTAHASICLLYTSRKIDEISLWLAT